MREENIAWVDLAQRRRMQLAAPEMLAALERAADALGEAMTVHIYDADNGDEPDSDCEYVATLAAMRAAIAKAKGLV